MIFRYKGIDAAGTKCKGTVEASSLAEAKAKLRTQNIIYTEISEEKLSFFRNLRKKKRVRIATRDLANLSRELSLYLRSGIGLVQALKIVQNHYTNDRRMMLFIDALNTYLDEGETFYSALQKQEIFELPEFYIHSIKVSETSGILDEVLSELSKFLKEEERIGKEVRSAFAYPSFMIVVSLVMIAFMLTFVVPQITGIFASLHQELPLPTRIVIASGEFFKEYFWVMVALFVTLAVLFRAAYAKSQRFRYGVDAFVLRLPFFGSIVEKNELARFSFIAALLVRSGIPFVRTINLSAHIMGNSLLRKLFLDASKEVVEGKPLSSSLNAAKTKIDFAFIQAIALGEETSQLEAVLQNLAELYFEENRDRISLALTLLEPVLMLFVGGTIGFIVAAMLLPIFSMSIQ